VADTERLLALIRRAVKAQLETGGPIGAVLSGGIDSSTIVSVAHEFLPSLPTFTGYYDGAGFDEREYARLVAGPEHHEILIGPQDFIDNFDAMLTHVRPPFQGMGTFGQYLVGKYLADEGMRVAISGEGGDELFGGYARLLIVAGEDPPEGYEEYDLPYGYPLDLGGALAYDFERLPDLLDVDDQCMAAPGIEARAPFTDLRLIGYVLAQDPRERVGKRMLKEAVRGIVPDAILARRDKMGFPIPLVEWAQKQPCRDFIGDRLGYLPDPDRPWERDWWLELCAQPLDVAA